MRVGHFGAVVSKLPKAIEWYSEHLGLTSVIRESPITAPGQNIAIAHASVRLTGVLMVDASGRPLVELHEHLEYDGAAVLHATDEPHPPGGLALSPVVPHLAFESDDLDYDYDRLYHAGMHWASPPWTMAHDSAYPGRKGAYGIPPYTYNLKIEIFQDPARN